MDRQIIKTIQVDDTQFHDGNYFTQVFGKVDALKAHGFQKVYQDSGCVVMVLNSETF